MEETTELSSYARFHTKFLGYSMKNVLTGQVYSKCIAYTLFPNYCDQMCAIPDELIKVGYENSKFVLVDSEGWKDGNLIK